MARSIFGFDDVDHKIDRTEQLSRKLSENQYVDILPKKQSRKQRSKSYPKIIQFQNLNQNFKAQDTHLQANTVVDNQSVMLGSYYLNELNNEEFSDLVFQTLVKIKEIPRRKLIRRKSCDTEMFGGKLDPKKDIMLQIDRPFDVLYRDFTIQELKREGKGIVGRLTLPWYLLKKNLQRRLNSLRLLVQNIALKKQIEPERKTSPLRKDRDPHEPVSQLDSSRVQGELKSVIDMQKFVAVLELCLNEKQQMKKSETDIGVRFQTQ